MSFFAEHVDILHQVGTMLDGRSLARLRLSNSFCSTLKSEKTVQYIASMRTLRHEQDLSTLEQIALAEALAELETEIRFAFRETTLKPSSIAPLGRLAAILNRHRTLTVSVEAHCGLEAPRTMGFAFSRERGRAVKEVLVAHGVAENRVAVRGYSNTRPLVYALGEPAGAANRRVELYVDVNGLTVPARRPLSAYAVRPDNFEPVLDGDFDEHDDDQSDDDGGGDDSDDDGMPQGLRSLLRLGSQSTSGLVPRGLLVRLHQAFQQSTDDDDDVRPGETPPEPPQHDA